MIDANVMDNFSLFIQGRRDNKNMKNIIFKLGFFIFLRISYLAEILIFLFFDVFHALVFLQKMMMMMIIAVAAAVVMRRMMMNNAVAMRLMRMEMIMNNVWTNFSLLNLLLSSFN